MQILLIIVSTTALMAGLYFTYRSSGSLSLGKLNVVSLPILFLVLQNYLGNVLIFLGFRRHYTLNLLRTPHYSIRVTFAMSMLTMVLWPLSMYVFTRLFKLRPIEDYDRYLKKQARLDNETSAFWLVLLVSVPVVLLSIAYFNQIGYLPIAKVFFPEKGFDYGTERYRINSIVIGSTVLRNIGILFMVPMLSYVTFAYSLATRKVKWIILALILFFLSLATKTYNFEKSPLVFHLAVYVFICIYYLGGIKPRWMFLFAGGGTLLLVLAYTALGSRAFFSLEDGIVARTIMTPVGVLAMNFDLFPSGFGFLNGRSMAQSILSLFGVDPELHIRSSRILMEYYGPEGVYDGTAGVMNTLFLGEAYANFGFVGAVLSIIWVGFVLSVLFWLFLKIRKSPATIALFAYMTLSVTTASQGGFFDFVYNATWLVALAAILALEYHREIVAFIRYLPGRIRRQDH